jgi:hypothetical protein
MNHRDGSTVFVLSCSGMQSDSDMHGPAYHCVVSLYRVVVLACHEAV